MYASRSLAREFDPPQKTKPAASNQLELFAEHQRSHFLLCVLASGCLRTESVSFLAMLGIGIAVHAALEFDVEVGAVLAVETQGEALCCSMKVGRRSCLTRLILATRPAWRPPSNSAPRNASRMSMAVS